MALTPLKELPDYTIGWGILAWCSKWLKNPDEAGGEKGGQWVFKPDQIRFILHFYAVNSQGEWICTQAYRERAKGTGKSPMVAAMACAEFIGPAKFSHFSCEHGDYLTLHCAESKAVGKPNADPVIWLAATSEAGTDHTYSYVMNMLDGEVRTEYNLDVGMTRTLVKGRKDSFIKQVTASPKSLEGPKPTFVVCEETQNWLPSEQGPALMAVIARGLLKTQGRRVEVTNAPEPGKGSVAEATHNKYKAIVAGLEKDPGMLFDTFMIHVDDVYDEEQAIPALKEMYADAPWMPPHLTYRGFFDQAYSEVDIRRFFFNEIVPPHAMWIAEKPWKGIEKPAKLKKSDLISLGFRSHKFCAAIVATRLRDSALFVLDMWERPSDADRTWEVPYNKINERMRVILEKYDVYSVVADPGKFQDIIGRWHDDYGDSIVIEELWTSRNRQKTANAIEMFETAVMDQRISHDGNPALKRHVMNCFVDEVIQGRLIRQETEYSSRYIIAAQAAVLSFLAAVEAIEDGALREPPDNELFSF